jgi:hypothetical protein
MKPILIFVAITCCCLLCKAQGDSANVIKEINEQVWKPFVQHFVSGNKEGFRNVHSKRVTRVEIDRNLVLDYDKYFPPIDSTGKHNPVSRQFELRFDKRINNGNRAWESGIFKGFVSRPGKPNHTYYGRFYVVLEKEDGIWKIIVDADTGKGADESSFNAAKPME